MRCQQVPVPPEPPASLRDCTHPPEPGISQMLQARSSRLTTFAPQQYLAPVFCCKTCLQEAALTSEVLCVLHHLSPRGGLLRRAGSPLSSLPAAPPDPLRHILVFPPCCVVCGAASQQRVLHPNLKQRHPTRAAFPALIRRGAQHDGCLLTVGHGDARLHGRGQSGPADSCVTCRELPLVNLFAPQSGCEGVWWGLPCAATV